MTDIHDASTYDEMIRHTLLSGEITVSNLMQFLIGSTIGVGSFCMLMIGINRLTDPELRFICRMWQGLLITTAGIVFFFCGFSWGMGLPFFYWWVQPLTRV